MAFSGKFAQNNQLCEYDKKKISLSKSLLKSGVLVSAMTLISRVLGLVRDIIIAKVMGASDGADAFFLANKIPNFLRRLFAEGAFAQAFVPVLADVKEKQGLSEVRLLVAQAAGTLGTILLVVTLLGVIGSPLIIALFGAGWFVDWLQGGADAQKYEAASLMLKITFPYLWFVSLTALAGAALNTYGKFGTSSFSPVLLNVCIIGMAWLCGDSFSHPGYALAWGVFIGGVAQLLIQLPALAKAGLLVMPKWGWKSEGVSKIRTLMIPALFGVSVSQINLLLDTVIASFLSDNAVSYLYYADRLLEFPLGLIGIGIATVILPALSKQKANESLKDFGATLEWSFRLVLILGVPAMVALILLAQPIISLLFLRGEFVEADVHKVTYALWAYLSGLVAFMTIKILAPGYYSRQDTKTPVRIGIIAMVSNMGFNLALAPWMGYAGLALATALSGVLNAVLLYRGLARDGVYKVDKDTLLVLMRVVLATGVMAFAILWCSPEIQIWWSWDLWTQMGVMLALILGGIACYFVVLVITGLRLRHVHAGRIADAR